MSTYSKATTSCLVAAGWYEGRQIDTTEMEELLRKEGYPVFPSGVALLREFGGLNLKICHFDIPEVIRRVSSKRIREDSENLERSLCLIGMMNNNDLWMTMDEDGAIYASYGGGEVFLVGNSTQEAIENLYFGPGLRLAW